MPEVKTDLEVITHFVKKAQEEKYFGDIVISFRSGELTYFRQNMVRTKSEVLVDLNNSPKKVLTNKNK